MRSIIITPKNKDEYHFIHALISKMKLSYKVLDEEEKEDLGLSLLMKKVDRSSKVSKASIVKRLRK